MKKAFNWLDDNNVAYEFHDYKKQGVVEDALRTAINEHGWEKVINQRGTTWRKLPDETKTGMNETTAINIALENPSIIKRPLLTHKNKIYLGFKNEDYRRVFNK